ncbi:MAG: ATP-binding cassette domain-containing protein [Planctomycetaceae bacterium]
MIDIEKLCVRVGQFCLSNISFHVPTGKYAVLMGRTGSGKTTILESICGLNRVDSGQIRLMGRDVTHLKPAERGIGFVPQDGALFSTMTVREQVGFALSIRGQPAQAIRSTVDALAELLDITTLLNRFPQKLSGGEKQRVALGRSLAAQPGVLCLDEPLSALDQESRHELCDVLKTVQNHTGVTILHITHNADEAHRLGDLGFRIQDNCVSAIDISVK